MPDSSDIQSSGPENASNGARDARDSRPKGDGAAIRSHFLDFVESGSVGLGDMQGIIEAEPAVESISVIRLMKALPGATDDRVAEMAWALNLRTKHPKTGKLVALKMRDLSPETFQAMDTLWQAGGIRVAPHPSWPWWEA